MKVITTREIQKKTRLVRGRLQAGESFEWVIGKKTVGYLVPVVEGAKSSPWPDLMERLVSIYGGPEGGLEPGSKTVYDDRD